MSESPFQPTPDFSVEGTSNDIDTSVTQAGDEYESSGRITIATRPGYAHRPTDENLPIIDSSGVKVTREQADAVMAEANAVYGDGHVFEVKATEADDEG